METRVKAFFYDYRYYAFPDDCMTLEEIKSKSNVSCRRLKEEGCMAPDFVFESIAEETLEIEFPERVFEVSVTLRTQAEYDEILKEQVGRVCPGCERFEDDGDLDGHHREISLDGLCYIREDEDEPWDFATCVDYFWYRISQQLDEMAKLIDAGDQRKLNKLFHKELSHFFPETEVYGCVREGRYCLMFAPDYNFIPVIRTMIAYLAEVASREESEMSKAGWEVVPFRIKGVYRHRGKSLHAAKVRLVDTDNPNRYGMEVLTAETDPKKIEKQLQKLYDYLCERLGENVVYSAIADLKPVGGGEMTTVQEAELLILEKYDTCYGDENPYPPSDMYGVNAELSVSEFPYRDKVIEGVTQCENFSFMNRETADDAFWLKIVSFFYLYVPRAGEEEMKVLTWYLNNFRLVPEPMRIDLVAADYVGVGFCGEEGFIIDCMVASEKVFFRLLRTIAPVLKALDAKVVAVNGQGVSVFECGYRFTPIDTI